MSDRCYVSITFAARDAEAVENEMGPSERDAEAVENEMGPSERDVTDGGIFHDVGFTGVNYGGDGELRNLTAAGVPFYGRHGAGDEYGACAVAGDGKTYDYHDCVGDGTLAVAFSLATGKPAAGAVEDARRFRRLWLRAKAAVRAKAEAGEQKAAASAPEPGKD